jgi:hypothetical protein
MACDPADPHVLAGLTKLSWRGLPTLVGALASVSDSTVSAPGVGGAEVGPKAAVNLGGLLIKSDDVERGRRALQYAVDSGHPEARASAALTLGSLLERDGDTDRAVVMYQHAVNCAVPEIAEAARRRLNALT